ncbi:PilZ domain-containing protein [Marinobacter sp. ANT_B65]|uniref:PilZ domain-containing protein n=1 Tax=Marinobacter sp. ANT_B65 TaxID=2039467 RepID=UPI000BBEE905|nr:PilZ domain-containing protein [Marinobacter sp. ANT_B65]PCM45740.1 pilus assembly protein PilZ [Marinobacter sp. ANT_B65]
MKDTDYTFGTQEDTPGERDNRSHYRLTARAQIMLETEASCPEPRGVPVTSGREVECCVRDMSTTGLRLVSHERIELGALLPASVSLSNDSEPFALTVEVIWCRPHGTDYLVGLSIVESEQTAHIEWTEAVAIVMDPF